MTTDEARYTMRLLKQAHWPSGLDVHLETGGSDRGERAYVRVRMTAPGRPSVTRRVHDMITRQGLAILLAHADAMTAAARVAAPANHGGGWPGDCGTDEPDGNDWLSVAVGLVLSCGSESPRAVRLALLLVSALEMEHIPPPEVRGYADRVILRWARDGRDVELVANGSGRVDVSVWAPKVSYVDSYAAADGTGMALCAARAAVAFAAGRKV